jgi:putative membrane protein
MAEPDLTEDASRRTRLANERTYLAWWRTGLTALAVGIGTGGVVPGLAEVAAWPYIAVGIAYSVLGIAFIVYGLRRLRAVEEAFRRGEYARSDDRLLLLLTAFGILLGLLTVALLVYQS